MMDVKKLVLKRRAIAVFAVMLVDIILYPAGGWLMFATLGAAASRGPFLFFSFAIGIVAVVFMLTICDGRFDTKLSNIFK